MRTWFEIWSSLPHVPGAELLAGTAVRGALLLAAAGLLTLALRGAPAASRHLVWSLSLTALLLLPVLPRVAVSWPASSPAARVEAGAPAARTVAPAPRLAPPPASQERPVSPAVKPREAGPGAGALLAAGLGIWLAGALLLAGRIVLDAARVWRLARGSRPVEDGELLAEVETLARRLGIVRRVRLLSAPADTMPLTWGSIRPVVLLPAGAGAWPAERRRVVLLHELAHIRRWDCLTQLVARFACALHWPNPLAWLAARRLLVERERACDELVVLQGTRRSDYAAHLVSVARELRPAVVPEPLTAPLACRTRLESRVAAILASPVLTLREARRRLAWSAVAALVLVTTPLADLEPRADPAPPVPAVRPEARAAEPAPVPRAVPAAPAAPRSMTPRGEEARPAAAEPDRPREEPVAEDRRVQWSSAAGTFEVTQRGEAELSADETAITRLESGGRLEIEHAAGSTVRRLTVTSVNGPPSFALTVDGRPSAFAGEGERWLASILPEVVSETGVGVASRVARLDRENGVAAVLAEVSRVENPRVRAALLLELLALRSLTGDELRQVADKAVSAVPEGYLAVFLSDAAGFYLDEPGPRAAWLEAVARIPSDPQRSRVLLDLLQRPDLDPAVGADLIRTADTHFETDNLRAAFLSRIADRALADETLRPAFLQSFGAIRTDRVLAGLAGDVLKGQEQLDNATRLQLLQMAFDHLHVDQVRAALLIEISDRFVGDPALEPAYRKAVELIRDARSLQRLDSALQDKGSGLR